ncbi:MAG: HAD hydrolase family protein [Candidatus Levyibacteriota bacterium]
MNKDKETEKLKLSEILGIPKKGIIFCDLDGVFFDEENNFASPNPSDLAILDEAKNAGFWIVLNSDTGVSALASFGQQLGCTPLVIGENGAVIYAPNQRIKEFLSSDKQFFDQYRKEVVENLIDPENTIILGDATSLIKNQQRLEIPGSMLYVVNTARDCSFGVYTRRFDENGILVVDDKRTKQTEELLKNLLSKNGREKDLSCKRYPVLGSCLVKNPRIKKTLGVKYIIGQMPKGLSYFMIGDTINDAIMYGLEDKVRTCAVGNATEELKDMVSQNGGIIAPNQFGLAKGVTFIIANILGGGK